jgi:hypothetical protein
LSRASVARAIRGAPRQATAPLEKTIKTPDVEVSPVTSNYV